MCPPINRGCWGEEDEEKIIYPQLECDRLFIEKKINVLIGVLLGVGESTIKKKNYFYYNKESYFYSNTPPQSVT